MATETGTGHMTKHARWASAADAVGAFDMRATMRPAWKQTLLYDVLLTEVPAMARPGNRAFLGTLDCEGHIFSRVAQFDAAGLRQVTRTRHLLTFVQELEAQYFSARNMPQRKSKLLDITEIF